MAVMLQHLAANMPREGAYGLFADRGIFGQPGNECMPQIVPAVAHASPLTSLKPGKPPRAHWLLQVQVMAIATSLAVAVALFKDEVLRWYRRPELSVRLEAKPPDCLLIPRAVVYDRNTGTVLWSGGMYWIRLWVENVGIGRAKQVQVFAARLLRRGANNRLAPVAEFEPMNLRWSNSRDANNPEIFRAGYFAPFR